MKSFLTVARYETVLGEVTILTIYCLKLQLLALTMDAGLLLSYVIFLCDAENTVIGTHIGTIKSLLEFFNKFLDICSFLLDNYDLYVNMYRILF